MDCVKKNRHAKGERHGTHTKPESVKRGDDTFFRRHPERVPRGSENGNSALTEDDVRQIRHMLSEGHTQTAVAKHFGISQTTVSCIALRKTWAHLANPDAP
jgi:response regulator of citrate/malate metabolism